MLYIELYNPAVSLQDGGKCSLTTAFNGGANAAWAIYMKKCIHIQSKEHFRKNIYIYIGDTMICIVKS